MKKTFTGTY